MSEAIVDVDDLTIYRTDGVETGGVRESVLLPLKSVKSELIRCKDCKHYDNEHEVCCVYLSYRLAKDANDYCSDAERKGD